MTTERDARPKDYAVTMLASEYDALLNANAALVAENERLRSALERSTHAKGDCDNLLCREQCAENRSALTAKAST